MIQTAEELAVSHGVAAACTALAVPRSSLYRARPAPAGGNGRAPASQNRRPAPRPAGA